MVSITEVCYRPRVMQLMQETRRLSRTDTTSMRLNESATCVCSQASYSEDQLAGKWRATCVTTAVQNENREREREREGLAIANE